MNGLYSLYEAKQRKLEQLIGARNMIQSQLDKHESEVVVLTERMANTEKAVFLLQKYSQDQQAMLAARVEDTVTAGLRAVFQNPSLSFKLHYSETKKGTTKKAPEVTMSVQYENAAGDMVSGSLKDGFGGGLAVVTAALLNIIVAVQLAPRIAPVLLWDEPLRDLSPDYGTNDAASGYRIRMADFLRTVVDKTDVQIILVTHEDQYSHVADCAYRMEGGIGKSPRVRNLNPQGEEA